MMLGISIAIAIALFPFILIWAYIHVGIRNSKDKAQKKELLGCTAVCLRGDYKGQKGIILDVYRKKVFSSEPPLEVRLQVPLAVADSEQEGDIDVEIILLLEEIKILQTDSSKAKIKGE